MSEPKLKQITINDEQFFYSLSFDVGELGGAYWLQLYDGQKRLVYDQPYTSERGNISTRRILKAIQEQLPFIGWRI